MRLSLGTNFDNDLLEQIADTKVKVVYGKLPQDIFGGGTTYYFFTRSYQRSFD